MFSRYVCCCCVSFQIHLVYKWTLRALSVVCVLPAVAIILYHCVSIAKGESGITGKVSRISTKGCGLEMIYDFALRGKFTVSLSNSRVSSLWYTVVIPLISLSNLSLPLLTAHLLSLLQKHVHNSITREQDRTRSIMVFNWNDTIQLTWTPLTVVCSLLVQSYKYCTFCQQRK